MSEKINFTLLGGWILQAEVDEENEDNENDDFLFHYNNDHDRYKEGAENDDLFH